MMHNQTESNLFYDLVELFAIAYWLNEYNMFAGKGKFRLLQIYNSVI